MKAPVCVKVITWEHVLKEGWWSIAPEFVGCLFGVVATRGGVVQPGVGC